MQSELRVISLDFSYVSTKLKQQIAYCTDRRKWLKSRQWGLCIQVRFVCKEQDVTPCTDITLKTCVLHRMTTGAVVAYFNALCEQASAGTAGLWIEPPPRQLLNTNMACCARS